MSRSKYEEYLICKERGHVAKINDNEVYYEGEEIHFSECKFCGTSFGIKRQPPELIEKYIPEPNPNELK